MASAGMSDGNFSTLLDSQMSRGGDSPPPGPPPTDDPPGRERRESMPPLPPPSYPDEDDNKAPLKLNLTLTESQDLKDNTAAADIRITGDTTIVDTHSRVRVSVSTAEDPPPWQTSAPSRGMTPKEADTKTMINLEGRGILSEIPEDPYIEQTKLATEQPRLKSDPLHTIIEFVKSSSYEEQEFQIGRDYAAIKDLQISVAAHAKQLALLEDDMEHLKKEIAAHKPDDKAKISAILQGFAEAEAIGPINPPRNLPHRDDSVCLMFCARLLYYLYTDCRYLGDLLQVLRSSAKDNKTLMTLICNYMYIEHWCGFKNRCFLNLLEKTLHDEMDRCSDVSSFLRGACPPIKLLSAYLKQEDCRRVLTDTLPESFILREVTTQDLTIKPMNVVMELSKRGMNVKADSDEVKKILQERLGPLTKVCDLFLQRIMRARLTRGMRRICKMLGDVARRKCPGDQKVVDGLIGGFVFLRFFNPYILETAQGRARRVRDSLVIVTKILQNISNQLLFQKEKYMLPLNFYMKTKFEEVHKFFARVTSEPSQNMVIDEEMGCPESCSVQFKTSTLSYLYSLVNHYRNRMVDDLKLPANDPLVKTFETMASNGTGRRVANWRKQESAVVWCNFWVLKGNAPRSSFGGKDTVVEDKSLQNYMTWKMYEGKGFFEKSSKVATGFLGTAQDMQEMKDLLLCGAPSGTTYFMWYRESKNLDERASKVYAWSVSQFCSIGSPNPEHWVELPGAVCGILEKKERPVSGKAALKAALIPAISKLVRLESSDAKVKSTLDDILRDDNPNLSLIDFCKTVEGLSSDEVAQSGLRSDFRNVRVQAEWLMETKTQEDMLKCCLVGIAREVTQRRTLHKELQYEFKKMSAAKQLYKNQISKNLTDLMQLKKSFLMRVGGKTKAKTKAHMGAILQSSRIMLHVSLDEIIGGLLSKFLSDVARELESKLAFAEKGGNMKTPESVVSVIFKNFTHTQDESEWKSQIPNIFPRSCSFYKEAMVKIATLCDCCVDVAVGQAIHTLPRAGEVPDAEELKKAEGKFSWGRFYYMVPSLRNGKGEFSKLNLEILDIIINLMATDVLMAALQHYSADENCKGGQISKSTYRGLLRCGIRKFGLSEGKFPPKVKVIRNFVASRWALVLGGICPHAAPDLCSLIRLAISPILQHQKDKQVPPISIEAWINDSRYSLVISTIEEGSEININKQQLGITKMATSEELSFFLKAVRYLKFDQSPLCISRAEKLLEDLWFMLKSTPKLASKVSKEQQTAFLRDLLDSMEHMVRGNYFAKGYRGVASQMYEHLLTNKTMRSDVLHAHSKRLAATILLRNNEEFFKARIQNLLSHHLLKGIIRTNRTKSEHLAVLLHFLRGAAGERYYAMPWIKFEGRRPLTVGYQRFGQHFHKLSPKYLNEIASKIFVHKKIGDVSELTSLSERLIVQMACHDASVVQGMLLKDLLEWDPTKKNWGRTFENRHLLALRCLECLVMEESGFQDFMASHSSSPAQAELMLSHLYKLFVKDQQIEEVFHTLMVRAEQQVGLLSNANKYESGTKDGAKDETSSITFARLSELVLPVLDKTPYATSNAFFYKLGPADKSKRGLPHYIYFYALRLLPKIIPSQFFQPSPENCIGDEKAADPAMFPGRLIVHEESMFSITASKSLHTIVRQRSPAIQSCIIQCFITMLHDEKMLDGNHVVSILAQMESLIKEWSKHTSVGDAGETKLESGRRSRVQSQKRIPRASTAQAAHAKRSQGLNPMENESTMTCRELHKRFPELAWHCQADALALIFANHKEKHVRRFAIRLMGTIRDLVYAKLGEIGVHPDTVLCVQDVWEMHGVIIVDEAVHQLSVRLERPIARRISHAEDLQTVCGDYDDKFYMQVMSALARQVIDMKLDSTADFALNYLCQIWCVDPGGLFLKGRYVQFEGLYSQFFSLIGASLAFEQPQTPLSLYDSTRSPRSLQELPSLSHASPRGSGPSYRLMIKTLHEFWSVVLDRSAEDDTLKELAVSVAIECHPSAHGLLLEDMLVYYHNLRKKKGKKALVIVTQIMQQLTASITHQKALTSKMGDEIISVYLTFIQSTRIQLWNEDKIVKRKWYDTQTCLIMLVKCLSQSVAEVFSGQYLLNRIARKARLAPAKIAGAMKELFDSLFPLLPTSYTHAPPSSGRTTPENADEKERPITRWEVFGWLAKSARGADKFLQEIETKNSDSVSQDVERIEHMGELKEACLQALRHLASLGKCIDSGRVSSYVQQNEYFWWLTHESIEQGSKDNESGVVYRLRNLSKMHPGQRVQLSLADLLEKYISKQKHMPSNSYVYRLSLQQVVGDASDDTRQIRWYQTLSAAEIEKAVQFTAPDKPGNYFIVVELFRKNEATGSKYSIDNKVPQHLMRSEVRVEVPSAHILPALLLFFHPTQLLAQFLAEAISGETGKSKLCVEAILQVFTTDIKPLSILPQSQQISKMIGADRFSAWSQTREFRDVTERNMDKLLFMALYQLGSRDRNTRFLTFQMLTCICKDWKLISEEDQNTLKKFSFAFESGITTSGRAYAIKISKLLAKSVPGFAQKLTTLSFNALSRRASDSEWILTFLLPWAGCIDLRPPRSIKEPASFSQEAKYVLTPKESTASSIDRKSQPKIKVVSVSSGNLPVAKTSSSDIQEMPSPTNASPANSKEPQFMDAKSSQLLSAYRVKNPCMTYQRQNKVLYDLLLFLREDRLRDRMVDFLVELGRNEDNIVTIMSYMMSQIYEVMRQRQKDETDYVTQVELRKYFTVVKSSIFAIYTRVENNRGFILELFFTCMRKHLTRNFTSQSSNNRITTHNIGQLQRTRIRYSLYDVLTGELKALDKDDCHRGRVSREQNRLVSAMVVEFIGIDREVVRPWLPEMVVYAIIALTKKNQQRSMRDVMCNLLVRLISAFETTDNAGSKTKRATDELEELVNSFEYKGKGDKEAGGSKSSREITGHLLKIFRTECPICVPQIGRAAFKWGVLSRDLSITRMAFTAYQCLLEPLDDRKDVAKQSLKGSAGFGNPIELLDDSGIAFSTENELVGMDSRVAIHTLLVKLIQLLEGCLEYSHFQPRRQAATKEHASAILSFLHVIMQHLRSIQKLHRHPTLLWAAAAFLRCDINEVYDCGLDMLKHMKSYTYLTNKGEIPQSFWAFTEGWHPRFTGVLLSLVPGMMRPETQAKTMNLVYWLIRLPCDSFIGLDSASSTRQIITIMIYLPWLHLSLRSNQSDSNGDVEHVTRTSLTPSKVLTQLATIVENTSKELAAIFRTYARPDSKTTNNKNRNRGDMFLERTCAALVKAYFPTYALPCANYLAAMCKSGCTHYHPTAFAIVNHMLNQPDAHSYVTAFQPIIEVAQRAVVEQSTTFNDSMLNDDASSASAQIIRAVMEVLLDMKKRRNPDLKGYRQFDVIPVRSLSNTVAALKEILAATPPF